MQKEKIMIVGGSSGLGLAVAVKAYSRNAEVIIASRSASEKHDELTSIVGPEIKTVSFDVTSDIGMEKAFQQVGKINHLVITTRPAITPAPFIETDIEQAKQAFDTKFWGQYRLIQKAHQHILPNGSIIMTTGIAGEKIYKNHSTMGVINAATETLCRTLAVELAPIRVNAVSPGFIAPKPQELEKYAHTFPSGRLASAEEVADAYIYLIENRYTTGTTLLVDGGARLI